MKIKFEKETTLKQWKKYLNSKKIKFNKEPKFIAMESCVVKYFNLL